VEPGLVASPSGRFFGWVIGATLPAALAADWLVSAWDQNSGMRGATPGTVAVEEVAAGWLLQLLGLPPSSAVGFATGATMANFTCLAAARDRVLARAGWDVATEGLAGGPRVRVLAGAERHGSVDLALRYLGLGAPELVAVDEQGRLDAGDLRTRLAAGNGPTIVCLQAGNVHSGAFDPFEPAIAAAQRAGAWVHVDGAFGLWAAVSPALAGLTRGMAAADSWATDAHKTLNTPYDGGVAIVADAEAVRTAMGLHASYLLVPEVMDPHERVPELSRRARGVPVWAALASLGSAGVRDLVEGLVAAARGIAEGLARIPGATVVNDVDYTQVCVAFESDERTRAVFEELLREGAVMPSASVWRGRAVIRFSVSSFRTGPEEVAATLAAVERAAGVAVPAGRP
jgi:glutamate/tyrosine decarboxylase-like PLP-dependent enzyme